jgi:hypothetical protein
MMSPIVSIAKRFFIIIVTFPVSCLSIVLADALCSPLRPTPAQRDAALCNALADILWQAGAFV